MGGTGTIKYWTHGSREERWRVFDSLLPRCVHRSDVFDQRLFLLVGCKPEPVNRQFSESLTKPGTSQLTLHGCTGLPLLDTLAPDLEEGPMSTFEEDVTGWYTIVDNGNAIVDKWKGHSIMDKLKVTCVRTR